MVSVLMIYSVLILSALKLPTIWTSPLKEASPFTESVWLRDKSPNIVNPVSSPTDVILGCAAVVTVAALPDVFWFNVGISEATNDLKLPAPVEPLGAA